MDHSQRSPWPQTPLNNLPNLPVQAPGPGPSCADSASLWCCPSEPGHASHTATSGISSRELKQSPDQENFIWIENWSLSQTPWADKGLQIDPSPSPPNSLVYASIVRTWMGGGGWRGTTLGHKIPASPKFQSWPNHWWKENQLRIVIHPHAKVISQANWQRTETKHAQGDQSVAQCQQCFYLLKASSWDLGVRPSNPWAACTIVSVQAREGNTNPLTVLIKNPRWGITSMRSRVQATWLAYAWAWKMLSM